MNYTRKSFSVASPGTQTYRDNYDATFGPSTCDEKQLLDLCDSGCWRSYRLCGNAPTDPHVCPFKAEINDDVETKCTCCDSCARECAEDI